MKMEMRTIDPALAAEWLATSQGNRALSHHRITALVSVIREGKWAVSPDAIAFADGHLANGHHRLTACVMSGMPITAAVHWLSAEEATESWRLATDAGRPRSLTDQTSCLAANRIPPPAVSALAVVVNRGRAIGVQPRARIMALWHQHGALAAVLAAEKGGLTKRAPVVGACIRAVLAGAISQSEAERFLRILANPANLTDPVADSAALVMLATVTRSAQNSYGYLKSHPGGAAQNALYLLTCAALQKFAKGEKCQRLYPLTACPFFVAELDEVKS